MTNRTMLEESGQRIIAGDYKAVIEMEKKQNVDAEDEKYSPNQKHLDIKTPVLTYAGDPESMYLH